MKRNFIILLVFGLFLLTSLACTRGVTPPGLPVASGTAQPVEKKLSNFSAIAGTKYMIAAIVTSYDANSIDFSVREYGSYGRSIVYNYIFFDTESETYRSLLPTNEQAILQKVGFPICCNPTSDNPFTGWLYYIVTTDTNGDGILSAYDRFTVAISDVGGNDYTELIPDVEESLGISSPDSATLFILYRAAGMNYHAKIDLTARRVLSTVEMPSFGEDVK
jgi:hypothetical protein